jgi:hypothetical protein
LIKGFVSQRCHQLHKVELIVAADDVKSTFTGLQNSNTLLHHSSSYQHYQSMAELSQDAVRKVHADAKIASNTEA